MLMREAHECASQSAPKGKSRAARVGGPALFGFLAVLVEACGPESRAVFDKMNAAACSGDADKFFAYVAEDKLLDNVVKRMSGEQAATASAVFGADGMRTLARGAINDTWRKDITENGKAGDMCGWSFVGAEKIGDSERVEVRSKAGNKKLLYFAKADGQMKLIDFQAVDVRSVSGDKASSGAPSMNDAPTSSGRVAVEGPNALDVCHRLEIAGVASRCKPPSDADAAPGWDTAFFEIPSVRSSASKEHGAPGAVLRVPGERDYGFLLGRLGGKKEVVLHSQTAHVLIELGDGEAIPADVQAKAKAVVDAL
jgi:hypothetical protein